ncbi:MAG: uroporphyrinogen-III C-methyltransferase, partial [Fibrobacteres bacterium]|nr:uroporphyrinogen-III C-methyltransferase [Fibrobacterota bacterium]
MKGTVTIVGAGPGERELITLMGKRALEEADAVIYDYLADKSLLDFTKAGAELIYAGKSSSDHTLPQDEINQRMQKLTESGAKVVRLKGGDPYIFGRGGEEAEFLAQHSIPFKIIPGIPSVVGAAAYSGIPLTDRSCSSSVTFVTGHESADKTESTVDWKRIAALNGTIVIYMGVRKIGSIVKSLLEAGLPSETPAAAIQWATTPIQKNIVTTIDKIENEIGVKGITHPAVIIIGKVVNSRNGIDWFHKLPLLGKSGAVTNRDAGNSKFKNLLCSHGAEILSFPAVKTETVDSNIEIDREINNLTTYNWLLFTSIYGVERFFARLLELNLDSRSLHNCKVGCIGKSTAEELEKYGIRADFIPQKFTTESFAQTLPINSGEKILIARSSLGSEKMLKIIQERGCNPVIVNLYNTIPNKFDIALLSERIDIGKLDFITFTSSSAANFFCEQLNEANARNKLKGCKLFSIGPETSNALRLNGLSV